MTWPSSLLDLSSPESETRSAKARRSRYGDERAEHNDVTPPTSNKRIDYFRRTVDAAGLMPGEPTVSIFSAPASSIKRCQRSLLVRLAGNALN